MTRAQTTDIAIIGAGVIGLAIAERLLAEGREVVLVDPDEPGMGASYGNAGTIADYAVDPVGTPAVLRNLPVASVQPQLAAVDPPCRAARRWRRGSCALPGSPCPATPRRNAAAIAALLQDAGPMWQDLALRVSGAGILQRRGCLYLYQTAAAVPRGRRPRWPVAARLG